MEKNFQEYFLFSLLTYPTRINSCYNRRNKTYNGIVYGGRPRTACKHMRHSLAHRSRAISLPCRPPAVKEREREREREGGREGGCECFC